MILVYLVARGSLMICRASARAASMGPWKVVIEGRFGPSAGEGTLPEAFGSLFLAVAAVLFVNSLSAGPVDMGLCGTTNFPSFAVLVVRASISLLPSPGMLLLLAHFDAGEMQLQAIHRFP
jgi:hypothetical protein